MSVFNRLSRLFGKQQPQETPDEFVTTVIEAITRWEHTSSLTVLEMPDDPEVVELLLQEWFLGTGTISEESSAEGGKEERDAR